LNCELRILINSIKTNGDKKRKNKEETNTHNLCNFNEQ